METSSGQYSPVYLPGEPLTVKLSRPRSTWLQSAELNQSGPARIGARIFACGSSAPVRVEHEDGAAAWLVGTLEVPHVQGHQLPPSQELWPYQGLFSSLLDQKASLASPFCSSTRSDTYRALFPGILLCCSVHQSHRWAPWLESYSVDQCIRHLKGHPGWSPAL